MISGMQRLNWVLSQQIGIDLRKLLYAPIGAAAYVADLIRFRKQYRGAIRYMPCWHDRREQAGAARDEYFWQDLLVARMIHAARPRRHVDVGSRIDGFVAHVASFRSIEVMDIRPLEVDIPGVVFRQADLMSDGNVPYELTDSLSCLHAIEHFGLGRYGDPLIPEGLHRGLDGLVRLLEDGGKLYLSCPCGEDEVYFNAHRAVKPRTLVELAHSRGLELEALWLFDRTMGKFRAPIHASDVNGMKISPDLTLGLYTFVRRERSA
jgi:hypothetical protein